MYNLKSFCFLIVITGLIINVSPFTLKRNQDLNTQTILNDDLSSNTAGGCNITHFEFWSNQTFAKSSQMDTVFTMITSNPVNLNNITKQVNQSVMYVIYNARTTLTYHNQNQTAQIIPPEIIGIADGFVDVSVRFSWAKLGQSPKNGSGSAQGYSQQIALGFRYKFNSTSSIPSYQLVNYLPFSCNKLALTSLEGNLTQAQKAIIASMITTNPNVDTLSKQIQKQVGLLYVKDINWFFNDKSPLTNQNYVYTWNAPSAGVITNTYNITRRIDTFSLRKQGVYYGYETIINDFPEASCGPKVPTTPFDPKTFGVSQSYVSLTFYENMIKAGIKRSQLDTYLTRKFWSTKNFNFLAGQLYDAVPNLIKYASPHIDVSGVCQADMNSTQVKVAGLQDLNVFMTWKCSMNYEAQQSRRFIEFDVRLKMQVELKPYQTWMDVWLKSYNSTIVYHPVEGFEVVNTQTANKIINSTIDKLYEGRLFGSGWNIYPNRNYPSVYVDQGFAMMHDGVKK